MNRILGVLVLYKCSLEESKTYKTLQNSLIYANSMLDLLVYDNSPESSICKKDFIIGQLKIKYLWDSKNAGVSKAYNTAAKYAKETKKDWILLLDQDTLLPENSLLTYLETITKNQSEKIIAPLLKSDYGFLSPSNYLIFRPSVSKKYSLGINNFKRKTLLNSGLLIATELFETVGGYNEKIRLDFSDTDFIARAKKHIKTFYLINVICIHSISTSEINKTKVITRYKFYCDGMKNYANGNKGCIFIYGWSFLRTIKLTFIYRDFTFIRMFLTRCF